MDTRKVRLQATFDQARAMFRDERRKFAKIAAKLRKAHWHECPANVNTACQFAIRGKESYCDIRRIVREVITDPKVWRAEFVCGRCIELDSRI